MIFFFFLVLWFSKSSFCGHFFSRWMNLLMLIPKFLHVSLCKQKIMIFTCQHVSCLSSMVKNVNILTMRYLISSLQSALTESGQFSDGGHRAAGLVRRPTSLPAALWAKPYGMLDGKPAAAQVLSSCQGPVTKVKATVTLHVSLCPPTYLSLFFSFLLWPLLFYMYIKETGV